MYGSDVIQAADLYHSMRYARWRRRAFLRMFLPAFHLANTPR